MCHECNESFETNSQVARHQRSHKQTYKDYILKWKYNNTKPLCKCGCNRETSWNVASKDFTEYVHGHHAWGRKKSDEEKRKIGRKNSVNMKRYYSENKDEALKKVALMNAAHTPETEKKRIESTKRTYENMTQEEKEKFSIHAKKLWSESRDTMIEAHDKATETFKNRAENGEYDFEERNQKISESITQRYLDGGFEWSRGTYQSTKTGKSIHYRSSWELELATILDNDPNVKTWEYEWESIPYTIDGVTKNYIPDFHVEMMSGQHRFIEVKPENLTQTQMNLAKEGAAREICKKRGWSYESWRPES